MHFLQAINSDLNVLIGCNKTGGTIKGDITKKLDNDVNNQKYATTFSFINLFKSCIYSFWYNAL